MVIKNIAVIIGAGLATRLAPISLSIPKVLVNYGSETVLKHLYNIYKGADQVIVAVPENMLDITRGYCKDNDLPITVIGVDKPLGSMYAIADVQNKIPLDGHNVIFNWSDIIPTFKSDETLFNGDVVYTSGNECRYNFDGTDMVNIGSTGGNVVGVYQFENYKSLEYFDGDLVEAIVDWSSFKQVELQHVVDIGDFEKLRRYSANLNMMAREFNEIKIYDDVVIKRATNERGIQLQKKEYEWYNQVSRSHFRKIRTPIVHSHDELKGTITMEKINGETLAEFLEKLTIKEREEIIADLVQINQGEKIVHGKKAKSTLDVWNDYHSEFIRKVIDRNDSVRGLVKSEQFANIEYVNGQKLGDLSKLIIAAFSFLTSPENLPRFYVPIHGDLNFSNILVDHGEKKPTFVPITADGMYVQAIPAVDFVMIDPRGYFGNSVFFGPKDYDIAKILYACSGYDKFNRSPDWTGMIRVDDEHLELEIEPLIDWEYSNLFEDKHLVMVAIIWMALAGYFKNNPYKAIASYFYGWHLLSKLKGKLCAAR